MPENHACVDLYRFLGAAVSHETALDKARTEYIKYQKQLIDILSPVELHFLEVVKEIEQIDSSKK